MELTIKRILPKYKDFASDKKTLSDNTKATTLTAYTVLAHNGALVDAEVNRYQNAIDTIQQLNR